MDGVSWWFGLIFVVVVLVWADRSLNGKPMPSLHIPTAEERDAAAKHLAEQQELWRLPDTTDILSQYTNHFASMPFDSDFVDPSYVEYFRLEETLFASMTKTQQKVVTRENSCNAKNNYTTGWGNYCTAFAGERMIRDRKGKSYVISMSGIGWNPEQAEHPIESAIKKTWWFHWERTHYPELIKKFNETGEFIPGWEWQPIDEIPDYHN